MTKFVLLVAGNICAGKSEFVRYLERKRDSFGEFVSREKDEDVVMIPEFIDPDALELFYHDRKSYTDIFEKSCLTGRQVRHMRAKEGRGIYIFDRGMIEGAETFARNSFEEGYLSHAAYGRYCQELKDGLDALGRTSQDSWLEQLIVYLQVPDVAILQDRQRQRNTSGEAIPAGYLNRINKLYEEMMKNVEKVYASYGVLAPRVLTIDARIDFREQPTYHQSILDKITTAMKEMKINER